MLSGHVDVVPALEPEWQSDPFELKIAEDRYFGRGACDMKGFVALAVNTLVRRQAAGGELKAPLALVITYDEEVGTIGARHFVDSWDPEHALPRRAIIGEPTSLEVVRLHKGHTKMHVQVNGVPAHSGYPHLGHCAIEPMGRAIGALAALRNQLKTERAASSDFFPEVPYVGAQPGPDLGRQGGQHRARPRRADDRLPHPARHGKRADRRKGARSSGEGARGRKLAADQEESQPADELARDRRPLPPPLRHRRPGKNGERLLRHRRRLVPERRLHLPPWGPGDIGVAHKPNEWLPKAEFERASKELAGIVEAFCA